MTIITGIYSEAIDTPALVDRIRDANAGGLVVFEGTTRRPAGERTVTHLEYEAYEPVAAKQLDMLAHAAADRWPLLGVVAVHRVGTVAVGEPGVLVAVTSPHRSDAFDACRWLIDSIKDSTAIWKCEVYDDGSTTWIGTP